MSSVRTTRSTLLRLALTQGGYFSTQQATALGISPQLLSSKLHAGTVERVCRGVYRIPEAPVHRLSDFIVPWLWSGQTAIVSHESALEVHDLGGGLPVRIHVTLPATGRTCPLASVVLHTGCPAFTYHDCVPVSTPAQAVYDVAAAHGDPDLVLRAIDDGIRRGLFSVRHVQAALRFL